MSKRKVRRRTTPRKQSKVKLMTINTPTQLTHADVMRMVSEKSEWLTTIDKRELAKKYGMSVYAVMRQLRGGIKKPSYDLLSDALDMIKANEARLLTRIA